MRGVPVFLSATITVILIVVLSIQLPVKDTKTPRMGAFLSPQKGFWQNAESSDVSYNATLSFPGLFGNSEVYFDDRLVPHIYAENETDAYFIQGFVHAKFRLWQMEFQTYAAGGRLSEIMGARASGKDFLAIDRFFRRLGMVYAAEQSLKTLESDPVTRTELDSYTAGINAYIHSLTPAKYPLEYKLLDYAPETWTNLKTALFLKYMSYDLAGFEQDFQMTNAKSVFTQAQFEKLYPYGQDSLDPIFPKGSLFAKAGLSLKVPGNADSIYFNFKPSIDPKDSAVKPDPDNGSNNWAVHGSKTASGRPILCDDPHLSLNLPSLWFEMQISTPSFSSYGVSFPGSPSIIIGFNNDIAFGFTNAMRDVRDYYEINFRDKTHEQYWYNGEWRKTMFRNEVIRIKGQPDYIEKIAVTIWGPVMYDQEYPDKLNTNKCYAVHWKAHDGTNELKTFNQLDHARTFNDYLVAISNFKCPGQNIIFASKGGDIAIKQQGEFPAKWRRQGDFVMPGNDSSYAWQGNIPQDENLVMLDPQRGFVSSANQYPYDTSYPYYLGGSYPPYRGMQINRKLSSLSKITPTDMQALQTDNYNVFAEMARPVLYKYLDTSKLNGEEQNYLGQVMQWNLRNDPQEKGPSIFTSWWDSLMVVVYDDDMHRSKLPLPLPEQSTLLESMIKDPLYEFADDINTTKKETLSDDVLAAFKKAFPTWQDAEKNNRLVWGRFKDAGIKHLLGIPSLSRLHLMTGGGLHVINATKQFHGPSWRMVVHLRDETEAYGVYPGGQSGNPGSKYYDNFVDTWAAGKYYRLKFLNRDQARKMNGKGKLVFSKSTKT